MAPTTTKMPPRRIRACGSAALCGRSETRPAIRAGALSSPPALLLCLWERRHGPGINAGCPAPSVNDLENHVEGRPARGAGAKKVASLSLQWGSAVVARQAHNLEIAGSIPAPTTSAIADGGFTPRFPSPGSGKVADGRRGVLFVVTLSLSRHERWLRRKRKPKIRGWWVRPPR